MNDKTDSIKVIEAQFSDDYSANNDYLISQDTAPFMAFWDLDTQLAPLFASYPKYVQEALYKDGKCKWGLWDAFYIPRKIFVICKDRGANHKFYHLKQFFPEYEYQGLDIANRMAQELESALHDMGIWPRKLSSPVAIYEDYYMEHLDLPTFADVPEQSRKILSYAGQCDNEWCENFKVGYFK